MSHNTLVLAGVERTAGFPTGRGGVNRRQVLFRALRPRYKTAILSNTPSDIRTFLTDRFHLEREVDTVIISAEEHLKKPQPEFYQLAAERLGVPLQENLFLDDESRYVEAARSLGMPAVQFINNAQAIPAMQQVLQVSG
jgi:FMN phosphatase YigB (HAD superfamily)